MADKYRVTVLREGATEDETLLEIAGGAAMVAKLAPNAMLEALVADAEAPNGQHELADRVFDVAVAAGIEQGAMSPAAPAGEAPKQRRPRRTKAQIEADNAAATAGGQPAPADDEPESEPVEPAAAVDLPQVPPAAEPVGNPEAPARVEGAVQPPYNPFAAG